MKSFFCWAIAIVFLFLGVTALDMHEYAIAVGAGVIALGLVWAAPSGSSSTAKGKSTAGRW